jgi:hypothetical protein
MSIKAPSAAVMTVTVTTATHTACNLAVAVLLRKQSWVVVTDAELLQHV